MFDLNNSCIYSYFHVVIAKVKRVLFMSFVFPNSSYKYSTKLCYHRLFNNLTILPEQIRAPVFCFHGVLERRNDLNLVDCENGNNKVRVNPSCTKKTLFKVKLFWFSNYYFLYTLWFFSKFFI